MILRRHLTLACLLLPILTLKAGAAEPKESAFSTTKIDFGVVVSDTEAAVKFYTGVVGMTEFEGFDVPGELGKDAGLTDGTPVHIHVLKLGEDEGATRLKLMSFPGGKSKPGDNSTIHAQLGISYLTFFVTDINAALARAKKAGVKVLAKGPVALPGDRYLAVIRDPDGNFVELVGPKK